MSVEIVKWVPVAERLPDDLQTVLYRFLYTDGTTAVWFGYCFGDVWHNDDEDDFSDGAVTHWAEMPAGPVKSAQPLEVIRWRRTADELPDADETVMGVWESDERDRESWLCYLDSECWRDVEGAPIHAPTWWAPMFEGPGVAQ